MKISDIFGPNIDVITNQKKTQKNVQPQNAQIEDTKNKNAPKDTVNISQSAKVLSNLANFEANHQKKLEAVQKAYESGTYKPDLAGLAKGILEEIKNG
ncbi:MAG TPA: flagellar biosynthesis anti-sigma factor FlgM [Desulfurella acetivorans]|uniref:Flagellar biosynthesis anti-sigma factor FlgM n=1 Tax=Desulfurella acetivorans TaxID=33002 RepID=A0A7C6EAM6_DESAE|nr:flagellar biosynthesis anti-sigma factor FlgM [Desulfurella acetivorans]